VIKHSLHSMHGRPTVPQLVRQLPPPRRNPRPHEGCSIIQNAVPDSMKAALRRVDGITIQGRGCDWRDCRWKKGCPRCIETTLGNIG